MANSKLLLPRTLDIEIKARLKSEKMLEFLKSLDLTGDPHAKRLEWLREQEAERFDNHWVETEVNYLLYGHETSEGLVCTGTHFDFYNFFVVIDTSIPGEATRKDICESDRGFMPHVHALAYNREANRNNPNTFLGSLHNHFMMGYMYKNPKTVEGVGFSPQDEEWNDRYLEEHGKDGRRLAFGIYYSDEDFYVGISRTKSTKPELCEIVLQ